MSGMLLNRKKKKERKAWSERETERDLVNGKKKDLEKHKQNKSPSEVAAWTSSKSRTLCLQCRRHFRRKLKVGDQSTSGGCKRESAWLFRVRAIHHWGRGRKTN
jgi:hypothetical protein